MIFYNKNVLIFFREIIIDILDLGQNVVKNTNYYLYQNNVRKYIIIINYENLTIFHNRVYCINEDMFIEIFCIDENSMHIIISDFNTIIELVVNKINTNIIFLNYY